MFFSCDLVNKAKTSAVRAFLDALHSICDAMHYSKGNRHEMNALDIASSRMHYSKRKRHEMNALGIALLS